MNMNTIWKTNSLNFETRHKLSNKKLHRRIAVRDDELTLIYKVVIKIDLFYTIHELIIK